MVNMVNGIQVYLIYISDYKYFMKYDVNHVFRPFLGIFQRMNKDTLGIPALQ